MAAAVAAAKTNPTGDSYLVRGFGKRFSIYKCLFMLMATPLIVPVFRQYLSTLG